MLFAAPWFWVCGSCIGGSRGSGGFGGYDHVGGGVEVLVV